MVNSLPASHNQVSEEASRKLQIPGSSQADQQAAKSLCCQRDAQRGKGGTVKLRGECIGVRMGGTVSVGGDVQMWHGKA